MPSQTRRFALPCAGFSLALCGIGGVGSRLAGQTSGLPSLICKLSSEGSGPRVAVAAGRPRQQHLAASARAGARRSRQRVCYVHESMCGEWSRQTRGGELPCTLQPTPSFSFFVIVVHENPQDYTASSPTPCLIQITRPHIPPSPPPLFTSPSPCWR